MRVSPRRGQLASLASSALADRSTNNGRKSRSGLPLNRACSSWTTRVKSSKSSNRTRTSNCHKRSSRGSRPGTTLAVDSPVSTTSHRTRRTVRGCQRTRPLSPVIVGPIMGCRGERSLPGLGGSSCSLPSSAQRRPSWSGIVSHPQRGSGPLGMIPSFVAGSASALPCTDASSDPRSRTRRRTDVPWVRWCRHTWFQATGWAPSINP